MSGQHVAENEDIPLLSTNLARRSGLGANLRPEGIHLFNNELLHPINGIFLFKPKVEFLHERSIDFTKRSSVKDTCRFANRLIGWVMPHLQIGMVQGLLATDTLRRVKTE